jgi:hypothetical protein
MAQTQVAVLVAMAEQERAHFQFGQPQHQLEHQAITQVVVVVHLASPVVVLALQALAEQVVAEQAVAKLEVAMEQAVQPTRVVEVVALIHMAVTVVLVALVLSYFDTLVRREERAELLLPLAVTHITPLQPLAHLLPNQSF